jgi:hypothetical protein
MIVKIDLGAVFSWFLSWTKPVYRAFERAGAGARGRVDSRPGAADRNRTCSNSLTGGVPSRSGASGEVFGEDLAESSGLDPHTSRCSLLSRQLQNPSGLLSNSRGSGVDPHCVVACVQQRPAKRRPQEPSWFTLGLAEDGGVEPLTFRCPGVRDRWPTTEPSPSKGSEEGSGIEPPTLP